MNGGAHFNRKMLPKSALNTTAPFPSNINGGAHFNREMLPKSAQTLQQRRPKRAALLPF